MRIRDVDFPQKVIDALARDELIIFAGAGVSIDPPSNYPDFERLAGEIGGAEFTRDDHEEVDRFLGRLVQANLPVHDRVKNILSSPESKPNRLHRSLISLYGQLGRIRIVTTNFDDHFTSAAKERFGKAPDVFQAPALPLGDDFSGIVHLHGSVHGPSRSLIVTDSDFGRAYLTEGWARRFVQRLFMRYVVLFVGYRHRDVPLLYLARGISAASPGPGRFALSLADSDVHWQNLDITPIHYAPNQELQKRHIALGEALAEWAERANLGSLETEEKIKRILTSARPISEEEADLLRESLRRLPTLRFFTRYALETKWLEWIREEPSFASLFLPGTLPTEIERTLSLWFAQTFAVQAPIVALSIIREKGSTVSGYLWTDIASALVRAKISGRTLALWTPFLLQTIPNDLHSDLLSYLLNQCTLPENETTALLIFSKLTEPRLKLEHRILSDDRDAKISAEVDTLGKDHWLRGFYEARLKPHIPFAAPRLANIVGSNLELARGLLETYEKADDNWDPISSSRGSVDSRLQDHLRNGLSILIDTGADLVRWANDRNKEFAHGLTNQWIISTSPVLQRLAIFALSGSRMLSADEKMSWMIEKQLVVKHQLQHEVLNLLAVCYGDSKRELREQLLTQAADFYTAAGEEAATYQLFNLLSWLNSKSPACDLAQSRLAELKTRYPQWLPREHPDYNTWVAGGAMQFEGESPISSTEFAKKNLDQLLKEIETAENDNWPFGFSKRPKLEQLAQAASSDFGWSASIAREAIGRQAWSKEIWSAFIRAWSSPLSPEQFETVLQILIAAKNVQAFVIYEAVSFLKQAADRGEDGLPPKQINAALDLADQLWEVCKSSKIRKEKSEEWLFVAINQPSGILTEFYLKLLQLLWKGRDVAPEETPRILAIFSDMAESPSFAGQLSRVLLASGLLLLAKTDDEWYKAKLLPLFDPSRSALTADQSWDGYLVWGRWTQELLPDLLPVYMKYLPTVNQASSQRSQRYCDHLAQIAIFGLPDPVENGWSDSFIISAGLRERLSWASAVEQLLRQGDQQLKDSAWKRWLQKYWFRRTQSTPMSIDSREAGIMVRWAMVLESHFSEAVELVRKGPPPIFQRKMIYYELNQTKLAEEQPNSAARLLATILRGDDGKEVWDLDQLEILVDRLIRAVPEEPELRDVCEALARIGSPRAQEFSSRLQSGRGPQE